MDSTCINMDVQATPEQGRIEIITGCMFSGKTQELIHRSKRAEISGKTVVGFKPEIDDRYNKQKISSHTGVTVEAVTIDNNGDIKQQIENYIDEYQQKNNKVDVVLIDEINLFESEIVSIVESLANDDFRVILSGLDQTFQGEPFDPVPNLLAIADHIEKRKAVCECCGDPATRTQRLIDGEPAKYDDPIIEVGGTEKYEPRCRQCHEVRN